MSGKTLTAASGNPAAIALSLDGRTALRTLLNTPSNPRTRRAYQRAATDL